MSYCTFATRSEADGYEATCRKALALPKKGRHVGGGRHVTIPPSPPGPGWTVEWSRVRKHPDRAEFAVVALEPERAERERLSTEEETELESRYTTRTTLDGTWESDTTATRER